MEEQAKKSEPGVPGERLAPQLRMMVQTFLASPVRNTLFALGIIKLNAWNKPFYDALSRKDFVGFSYQLVVFAVIAGALLVLNVSQAWLREMSKLKLREGLSRDLFDQWLTPKRAFRLTRIEPLKVAGQPASSCWCRDHRTNTVDKASLPARRTGCAGENGLR